MESEFSVPSPCGWVHWVKESGFPLEDCEPCLLGVSLGPFAFSRSVLFVLKIQVPCAGVSQDFMVSPWAALTLAFGPPLSLCHCHSPHQDDRLGVLAPGEEH